MKVLAVGDIHTKTWIIMSVLQVLDDYDAVVFVGDYADDWGVPPSRTIATWKALQALQQSHPKKVHLVLGNHDYIYVNYTKSVSGGYSPVTQMILDSPENQDLKEWLKNIPVTLRLDDVVYSHAGITYFYVEGHDLWDDDSPLWARPSFAEYEDYPQVFGHTPSETCWEVKPDVWCIDTFSTMPDGSKIGDETVLEVIDGQIFNKVKLW